MYAYCGVVWLLGDDLHISVNMRGGPEKWQVTGWLQIIDLQKQHEGDYTCVAQNEHGVDRATARVNVVDPRDEGLQLHLSRSLCSTQFSSVLQFIQGSHLSGKPPRKPGLVREL